ncbi:histidine kinase [Algoriphagus aquimarinus]|uniref:Histidine kinase n=1 Tax=Algoriphagus aquimarinus TaxID=237018 RepID=A0A1I1B9J9_9BACT|nr:Histidine kinase [Algoriphagus aquimarinus]
MKTILRQFLNQETITNNSRFDVERLFNKINSHPVSFIWILWTAYLGLDILVRFTSNMSFTFIKIIALNYFAGGVFNQFWFFVFLPNLVYLKKWRLQVIIFLLGFLIFLLIKYFLLGPEEFQSTSISSFVIIELVRIFKFLLFITIIWAFFFIIKLETDKYKLELEFEKLQVEHNSLQLSPHFVLNLVSDFAASILHLSKSLFDDLTHFTAVLSYSYKKPKESNFLSEEILAIESYILCQKQRFDTKLNFLVVKDFNHAQVSNLPIPKWTLMTFLENVFKHGNCFHADFPCMLTMKIKPLQNGMIVFAFSLINSPELSVNKSSTKFGIPTVDRILNFHFRDHYKLFISENTSEFNLFLYIEYEGNFTNWHTRR